MKLIVFGLTVSSSWGNGHATIWRGLCRALIGRGHQVTFFERDVPYYAAHRDLSSIPGGELCLYPSWEEVLPKARQELSDADVAIVTSYCPDGVAASELVLESSVPVRTFYDLDTPITLQHWKAGDRLTYVGPQRYTGFDLVLSYTGGRALEALQTELGAKRVAPLYGSVDPAVHFPVPPMEAYRGDLSYLGTYAADRQPALETLLVGPARRLPQQRFVIGGAQYPADFPWTENIFFVRHLPPGEHSAFYCSSRLTLNVTRQSMAAMGFCPSGRLFEAAACGVPILSDSWEGLDAFFQPNSEILIAQTTEQSIAALQRTPEELSRIGQAARRRALAEHTAECRAIELERIIDNLSTLESGNASAASQAHPIYTEV